MPARRAGTYASSYIKLSCVPAICVGKIESLCNGNVTELSIALVPAIHA